MRYIEPIDICMSPESLENKNMEPNQSLRGLSIGLVGMIFGAGGVGKGMLALQACVDAACGSNLTMLNADSDRKLKTLYLSNEEDEYDLTVRLANIFECINPISHSDIRNNMAVKTFIKQHLHLVDNKLQRNEKGIEKLEELCRDRDLVILDTISNWHSLDENDSASANILMSVLQNIASKCECSLVFINHQNKSGKGSQASMGSVHLTNKSRWVLHVTTENKKPLFDVLKVNSSSTFKIKPNSTYTAVWHNDNVFRGSMMPAEAE